MLLSQVNLSRPSEKRHHRFLPMSADTTVFPDISVILVAISDVFTVVLNLLLISLSSLLNTLEKMNKGKLHQNFYTAGRNNEAKSLSSNLTRKYYSINSQLSEPILEVYGNICVLQYYNAIWTSSDHIPSGFYPKILSGIWTPVSSSDDLNAANEYRLCIQSNGAVVLQKNGINISDNTSIRGQAIWII